MRRAEFADQYFRQSEGTIQALTIQLTQSTFRFFAVADGDDGFNIISGIFSNDIGLRPRTRDGEDSNEGGRKYFFHPFIFPFFRTANQLF